MKKSLTLIMIYILACVLGSAALATLFMFNADMMMYVTDVPSSLFSLDFFLLGLCLAMPMMSIAALIAIVLIMVRSRKNQLPCFFTYVALGVLTWLVVIPFSVGKISRYENSVDEIRIKSTSAGVFRGDPSGVFYFSRVLENGNTDGIFIDTSGYLGQEGKIISFYDSPVNNASAYPYSDVLVKNTVQPPAFVTFPVSVYMALLTSAHHYHGLGFLSWLGFASLGLAIISIYGVQFQSEWKITSALCVITAGVGIILINYLYYMDFLPGALKQFAAALRESTSIDNSLVILMNLVWTVLFALYGVVMMLYRKKKNEVSMAGEES